MSGQKPDDRSDDCNRDNCRYENTGNTVCDLGNRSLCGGRVTYHFNDLGEGSVLADAGCFAFNKSGLVDSSGRNKISGGFVDRDTFAGKSGFVDSTGSLDDHTIDWDIFTRTDNEDISFMDLFDRDGSFLTIAENNGGLRCKFHKTLKCVGGFSFRTCLEHFSNGDQSQDHCGRFKVKFHHVIHDSGGITIHLCTCHGEECINTPYKRCHGAECNECIHVWGTMPQTLKSTDKEFLVDDHDDAGEQKLDKTHCNVVVIKPCRQRPSPHHVAHGEVHQYKQKSDRSDQTTFENRCLVIFESFLCFRHGNLLLAATAFQ